MHGATKKETMTEEMQIISLRDLLEMFLLNLRLLGIFFAVFLVLGILYAYFKAPVFQSRALLQVSKSGSGSNALLSQFSSMSGGTNDQLKTQQYILSSRGVLARAIATYHLDIVATPWHLPIFGTALANHYNQNPLHVNGGPAKSVLGLSRYGWGGDHIVVDQFTTPESLQGKSFTLIYLGNDQYKLIFEGKTIIAGKTGQLFIATHGADSISLLVSKISANPNTHFMLQKLSMLNAIRRVQSKISVAPAGMQTDLLSVVAKGQPREQLQSLLSAVIDNAISLSVQVRAIKAQKVLEFVNDQLPVIHAQLDKTNTELSTMMPMGSKYDNLEQQKNIQNSVYTNMLVDVAQYDLQKASSLGDITVITPPTAIFPVQLFSNAVQALLVSFVGLLLGLSFVFVRHYLMGIVFDPEKIEQITGLNLLAGLQIIKSQTQQISLFKKKRTEYLKVLSELEGDSAALEGFRGLRTSLFLNHFSSDAIKNNIITVSGPIPGIGKSFISVNLAQQLAEVGKRVLLIDADLRKGTIANYFDPSIIKRGFVDLIKGTIDAKTSILKTRFSHLDVIPSGELQGRNAELLVKKNIENILAELSAQYDYVVIDTAPVLMVSDALSICRYAGTNLMVFAYGKHNEREIDIAVKQFEKANVALHGFVMNFMPIPKLGYGYGYGYGYGEHDEKVSSS